MGEPFDSPLILSPSKDKRPLRMGVSNQCRAVVTRFALYRATATSPTRVHTAPRRWLSRIASTTQAE